MATSSAPARSGRVRAAVAVGGASGALLRGGLLAGAALAGTATTVVTLVVINLVGAGALGWLVGRGHRDATTSWQLPLLGTGVLGAFTTFATLADHVARIATDAGVLAALAVATLHLAGGVAAAAFGLRAAGHGTPRTAP